MEKENNPYNDLLRDLIAAVMGPAGMKKIEQFTLVEQAGIATAKAKYREGKSNG